jgi:hypothetical protein
VLYLAAVFQTLEVPKVMTPRAFSAVIYCSTAPCTGCLAWLAGSIDCHLGATIECFFGLIRELVRTVELASTEARNVGIEDKVRMARSAVHDVSATARFAVFIAPDALVSLSH